MNKKILLVLVGLLVVVFLYSCKKSPEGPTDIRIRNKSSWTFRNVNVDTSGGEHNYGTIAPEAETGYFRFDVAYREAHITLDIDNVPYEFIPVAYTYEVPLGRGKFTYELSVVDTVEHTLAIHVIADAPLK